MIRFPPKIYGRFSSFGSEDARAKPSPRQNHGVSSQQPPDALKFRRPINLQITFMVGALRRD
jgi:hypothetical protein